MSRRSPNDPGEVVETVSVPSAARVTAAARSGFHARPSGAKAGTAVGAGARNVILTGAANRVTWVASG